MTDRKKPGVAFWATVVVVVALVAYSLSFGPACWIAWRVSSAVPVIATIYSPLVRAGFRGPAPVRRALWCWGECCAAPRVTTIKSSSFDTTETFSVMHLLNVADPCAEPLE
jgi:hypothetical protein